MTRYVDIDAARGDAGPFEDGYPFRIVMHTTETLDDNDPTGTADPERWIPGWIYPSNWVIDYERDTVYRILSLDRAGKALYNAPGGVSTNTLPCVQVEINGSANGVGGWPVAKRKWIAARLAEIVTEVRKLGYDINLDPAYQVPAGAIAMSATETAPQRMTFGQWNAYHGLCGHRHVPENDHWDAGALDLQELAGFVQEILSPTPIPPIAIDEDDMPAKLYRVDGDNKVWAVKFPDKIWVQNQDDLWAWRQEGLVSNDEPTVLATDVVLRNLRDATPKVA